MNSNKVIQYGFWIVTAILIAYISSTYIPYSVEQLSIDRSTLRVIVPERDEVAVWIGGEERISVGFLPDTAIATLSWWSEDENVATVDDSGLITGVRAGTANIGVTDNCGVTSDVTVQVLDKILPPGSDYPEHYNDVPMIANVDNNIGSYTPDLVTVPDVYPAGRSGMQLTPETFDAYKRMYADCKAATGSGFYLLSAYRSYSKQQSLFDEDVASYVSRGYSRSKAIELTAKSTQYPGCSEHQLGETVDIGNTLSLNYSFNTATAGRWITEHAHEYGFILRYPKDKEDITGIVHEAWHFRYVGVEHAAYIYEHGLCLEEYIELQQAAAIAAEDFCAGTTAQQYLDSLAEPLTEQTEQTEQIG